MSREQFEELVLEALKSLPPFFQKKMENVEIVIEEFAPPYIQKRLGIHPYALFGLYQGVPLKKRGSFYGNVLPDKITIFQRPIELAAGNEEAIKELVKKVVMHEIAHHFGFDEKELRDLGL
ncbi:MAG: metallopeptidase family protein [candidate division WOR-3 bacterium]